MDQPTDPQAPVAAAEDDAVVRTATISNRRGLHARAAAKFVKLASQFDAEVEVRRGDLTANGRSIMGLMMLSAGPGTTIVVSATGPEAEAALEAITELVASKFNEETM
jgi:phosphocarrier protein